MLLPPPPSPTHMYRHPSHPSPPPPPAEAAADGAPNANKNATGSVTVAGQVQPRHGPRACVPTDVAEIHQYSCFGGPGVCATTVTVTSSTATVVQFPKKLVQRVFPSQFRVLMNRTAAFRAHRVEEVASALSVKVRGLISVPGLARRMAAAAAAACACGCTHLACSAGAQRHACRGVRPFPLRARGLWGCAARHGTR
jgi:hypothetical protein